MWSWAMDSRAMEAHISYPALLRLLSYQYRDSHYKDKTASWPVIFIMEITIPGKSVFILKQAPYLELPHSQ